MFYLIASLHRESFAEAHPLALLGAGHDHSSRVRWIVEAFARLAGMRSLIIDGEP
jgi:hypothetical protein